MGPLRGGPTTSKEYAKWVRRTARRRARGEKEWKRLLPSERLLKFQSIAPNGCWLYTGAKDTDGYGRFCLKWAGQRKTYRVPRMAYLIWKHPIPDDLVVDHICNTPACFNPDHLQLLTPKQNTLRGKVGHITHCKRGHPFTAENTRMKPKSGQLFRQCRICQNLTQREMRARKYGSPTKDRV